MLMELMSHTQTHLVIVPIPLDVDRVSLGFQVDVVDKSVNAGLHHLHKLLGPSLERCVLRALTLV
jgi:hypothetical protein